MERNATVDLHNNKGYKYMVLSQKSVHIKIEKERKKRFKK